MVLILEIDMPVQIIRQKNNPLVSVIIPSLDGYRDGNVPKLVQALENQSFQDFEVLVVVGEKPCARAHNVGVQSAQGEIAVFFDDDITLGDDKVVENLITPLVKQSSITNCQSPIGITGASTLIPPDANRFQKLCAREFERFEFPVVSETIETDMATHAAMAMEKKTFTEVGGENENLIFGDDPELRPGIVHRLDKETSGILVMAKNQKAFEFLKSQFQNREVVKKYLALVEGKLKKEKDVIVLPIGRSVNDFRKKMAAGVTKGELKDAITEYETLESFPNYTLVEVYPKTGRTHQVRVHFKAIGNPVVCDSLYGGKRMTCPFDLARHFLHANFLEFTAPSGAKLKIEADLPEDLEKVLKGLREK